MARGVTLVRLLDELRAEVRNSQNPAHNSQVRDPHIILLQREQERLWEDFPWPHLRVERFIPVAAGQRYYAPPADLHVDRIESIEIKTDGEWIPVGNGINAGHYAAHDSALDQRAWPVQRWAIAEEDQIEIWPISDVSATVEDQNGFLKITGIRNLKPLVADSDRADLDSRLLVLYVAGGLLAATGAKDAQLKLEAANRHYAKLKGLQVKTKSFNMFGTGLVHAPRRPVISRYRAPGA